MPIVAASRPRSPARSPVPFATALVALVLVAYANVVTAPFLFDDISAIVTNPTIRRLGTAFAPPADGTSVTGRPLVNLSFAVNHAISGQATWSYHLGNIVIHAAAALALFGLVRRTLHTPHPSPEADQASARNKQNPASSRVVRSDGVCWPAFAIAALWALHPLQTESVSLVSQRTESLCGLFYLLTLYAFARGTDGTSSSRAWLVLSVLACLGGMATKEVMVTAPLLVLLYDRTFVARSFAAAWRQRRAYYGALAATWLPLAWLVLGAGGTRGDAAGLGLGVSWWTYLLKQCEALVLYLKLSFWPHPLVVDYGGGVVTSWTEVWWQGPAVLVLLAVTVWALVRRPVLGFFGAWFFVILAPSSSVVPLVSQTMAEHRMYLPLAAVVALTVSAAWSRWGARTFGICAILALVAAGLTFQRNRVFKDELSLWSDTVARQPANMRAHNNLAIALADRGRFEEAVTHYQAALRLSPDNAEAHLNLCLALLELGRLPEAIAHGETAVRLRPGSADAHINLASAFLKSARPADALHHYEQALRLQPTASDVAAQIATLNHDLGNRAAAAGRFEEAIARYRRALVADPGHFGSRQNLANSLLMTGRTPEAIALYRELLAQRPNDARLRENLARALELAR